MRNFAYLFIVLMFFGCGDDEKPTISTELYFPPNEGAQWESISPATLGWDTSELPALLELLENNGTRAFVLLKNGKIVLEEYFGQTILLNAAFTASSNWYWASAGKTLTAFTVGIAQNEGYLQINDKTSAYLGQGWTSLSQSQEDLITIRHQLTMTSGLDDGVANRDDYSPESLTYKSAPGTRWAYHNAPYTLLQSVVENATETAYINYFNSKLRNRIGMDGFWQMSGFNKVYFSTARSMARFGLLVLADGKWKDEEVLDDKAFIQDMIKTSQDINLSYGYLWWLNGKSSFMLPQIQAVFPGSFNPDAPVDMVSGLGRDGQYLSIVPSQNIVLVRMGENPDGSLVPITFQNDIWRKLNEIIK